MTAPFTYESHATRVVFGPGVADTLASELERMGATRAVVLATPNHEHAATQIATQLGSRARGVIATARMHVPVEVAAAAARRARELDADCTIGYGGGSTIGLGKAIALELGLPQIAIPTTYAGSEMTTIWGLTDQGTKRTGRDARVLPKVVLYDPRLTIGLSPRVTAASGLNAMAHAVEALYSTGANPVTTVLAEEAARALASALPRAVANGADLAARGDALYGAYLAGHALGSVPMALHHQLCHLLGGTFDLPHAELHALVLPHVVRFNAASAPDAIVRLGRALGAGDPAASLRANLDALALPTSLEVLGVPRDGLAAIAARVAASPYPNPRPIVETEVAALLAEIYTGRLS
ncbi:MAG TPA: maleylacetate reductase [Kofleriaceae bacterium]|nr:maleylacetate reductase [Kofleriaceae bacterium]